MGFSIKSRLSILAAAIYLAMPSVKEPGCALDHTLDMNIEENVLSYGYPFERHSVETDDGYYLNLVRFPRNDSIGLPVLIVHGFSASSKSWVILGPKESLGYKLFDAGHDVWLADLRGNEYSSRHKTLEQNDSRFWDFSLHELGRYDQPAIINYVLNMTGRTKLIHVGYSMGSGSFFIMNALRPDFNDKVETHIAMAPGVFFKHSTSVYWMIHKHFVFLNQFLGDNGSAGAFGHGLMQRILKALCTYSSITKFFGYRIVEAITGPSDAFKNDSLVAGMIQTGLAGSSVKIATHFLQLHESGKFQQFDYGSSELNLEQYNQSAPPLYNLSQSTVPVYIIHGATDVVCPQQDVSTLKSALNSVVDSILIDEIPFNHGDFFIGTEAATKLLHSKVGEMINLINKNYRMKNKLITKQEETSFHENTKEVDAKPHTCTPGVPFLNDNCGNKSILDTEMLKQTVCKSSEKLNT